MPDAGIEPLAGGRAQHASCTLVYEAMRHPSCFPSGPDASFLGSHEGLIPLPIDPPSTSDVVGCWTCHPEENGAATTSATKTEFSSVPWLARNQRVRRQLEEDVHATTGPARPAQATVVRGADEPRVPFVRLFRGVHGGKVPTWTRCCRAVFRSDQAGLCLGPPILPVRIGFPRRRRSLRTCSGTRRRTRTGPGRRCRRGSLRARALGRASP